MVHAVLKNPWVRAIGVLLALLACAGVVYLLLPILTALFFSFLVAYIFHPLVDRAERHRIPRMVTILVILVALLVLALSMPLFIVTNVIGEAERFVLRARAGFTEEALDGFLRDLPLRELVIYLGWAPEGQEDFNERAILVERLGAFIRDNALEFLRNYGLQVADMGRQAGRSAAQMLASFGSWVLSIASFVVNLSLFVFVSVYLLRDYAKLVHNARELLPPRHRPGAEAFMGKVDLQLRSLLRGQVIVCAALALLYGVGLYLAGAPFFLPIALFGGAASVMPYVGPMFTLGPALLFTLLFHGVGSHFVMVLLVFAVVQMIESYVLTPRVLGSQIGLNPVWIIVAFMVFSSAFGFLGMVLAVPLAAVLKVAFQEGRDYYKRSAFFTESPGNGSSPDSAA